MVVSMIAVGGIVGLLLFNTSMQQASFAATDLQNRADSLLAQQQTLQMQLDRLRDPQLIAEKAQRMGMVLPTNPAVLDLRSGKVLGQPSPATGIDRLRLLPPPPVKPASLDPAPHVTVVQPPAKNQAQAKNQAKTQAKTQANTQAKTQGSEATRADSSGRTGHAFRADGAHAGRQGTTANPSNH
jgi:hypothetical protein